MHIQGLSDFTLAEIQNYIVNRSRFLPVLGRIKLPTALYPEHHTIETTIKIAAAELGYLRLAEVALQKSTDEILNRLKTNAEDTELQNSLAALNLQKEFVLSLNEQITIETLKYFYFTVLWPVRNENEDKKLVEEISSKMHGKLFKKNKITGMPERNADSTDFGDLIELVSKFLMDKRYQSERVELPKDANLYLSEYLHEPLVDDEKDRKNRKGY